VGTGVATAFHGDSGSIVFTDEGSDVMIALTPELPAEASAELVELEIDGQRISWDADEQAGTAFAASAARRSAASAISRAASFRDRRLSMRSGTAAILRRCG
jgi:hypothetical protein